MGHKHAHDQICHTHVDHQQSKALQRALWIAFIFMLLEIGGGLIANSLALISDALHMFTDVGAMLVGIIVLKITQLPRTAKMSYGYHRAEILGALASSLSLWALSCVLVYESIKRLINPPEVEGPIVFVIASFGLIANILMFKALHSSKEHSLNMKAAYLHVIGDLLGSAGVIISGLVLWLTGWNPIDPITTLLFTFFILASSGKVIKETCGILMESTPKHINPLHIENDLKKIPGVKEVHDLHIWSVSSKKIALSAHIVAETPHNALNEAHRLIEKKYDIHHMTIQVEDPSSFESRFCYDCDNYGQPSQKKI